MVNWSWQIVDSGFSPVGEVQNCKSRKLQLLLNKINTASFNIRLDNPLAYFLSNDLGYLKVYRNKKLLYFGPLISIQEVGQGENATMQVTSSGPEWIFSQRLVGKTFEGIKFASGVSRATRFVELLEKNEAAKTGEIGKPDEAAAPTYIDHTTGPISCSSTTGYESSPFKLLSEVLNDLSNTTEGFDWNVYPKENYENGAVIGTNIGRLVIADVLNTVQENAAFEWHVGGEGRNNIASFTRTLDRSTLLNRAYNIGPGGPDATGSPTEIFADETSILTYGVQEGVVSSSILNNELREKLVQEAVEVRKNPRHTVVFQPVADDETGRVPVATVDYNVGDSVPLRLVFNKIVHLEALVRIWGVEFDIDENEKETQTLTTTNT